MRNLKALVLTGFVLTAAYATAAAEPLSYYLPEDVSYDEEIPTPSETLGFEVGEMHVRSDLLVQYMYRLAAASDRIAIEEMARSHEKRPLLFLTITSPENHARLDEIKAAHLALSDPDRDRPVGDDMPVVVWLNYSVHGDEPSGANASLLTVYHLAAAEGAAIEETLDNAVILLVPVFNPDGLDRQATWANMHKPKAAVTDPAHRGNLRPWPRGRTNHYWFDLNRQWLLVNQPEPQGWVAKFHAWRPNIAIDFHEMGPNATYYFHPGVPTRTNPWVPERSEELMYALSDHYVDFLDADGALYYTEETFDNFYVGKGSTYPHVNGAVGILFEAAGGRGGKIENPDGFRTFAQNIRLHFRMSLSSIAGGQALRTRLLAHQKSFVRTALEEAASDPVKGYIFAAPGDPERALRLRELLTRHQIGVSGLDRSAEVGGATYRAGEAWVVASDQPQYRMIKLAFETPTEFEDETFYDVSAWTLPLSHGLQWGAMSARELRQLSLTDTLPAGTAQPAPAESAYGYIFPWAPYYAPRAVNRLLSKEVRVKAGQKPVSVQTATGTVALDRGSIFVPAQDQKIASEAIHALMSKIAAKDGVPVYTVESGRTPQGVDLGGPNFDALKKPEVLLATGAPVSQYDAGAAWYILDHHMRIPVSLRDIDEIGGLDLGRYTHIVLPGGGSATAIGNALGEETAEKLKTWVADGGTVIALRHGAKWAQSALLAEEEEDADEAEDAPAERYDYGDKERRDAIDLIGGAIYASDLDITHPLGFGYATRALASHKNTELIFETPDNPVATVARYGDTPLLAGYSSETNREKLAGTPMAIAERKGAGSVILLADDPNFRGYWLGTTKLFVNGFFFSKLFEKPDEVER